MRLFLVVLIQSSYSLNPDTENKEKVFNSQKMSIFNDAKQKRKVCSFQVAYS